MTELFHVALDYSGFPCYYGGVSADHKAIFTEQPQGNGIPRKHAERFAERLALQDKLTNVRIVRAN